MHKGRIPLLKKYGNLYFTTTKSNMRDCILVSPLLNAWCAHEFTTRDICTCIITCNNRTLYIVSAYHDINHEPVMERLAALLETNRRQYVLIGSDTNSHSTMWGCEENNGQRRCARGPPDEGEPRDSQQGLGEHLCHVKGVEHYRRHPN